MKKSVRKNLKNLIRGIQLAIVTLTMFLGIWLVYSWAWHGLGFSTDNWAAFIVVALSIFTEYGIIVWIREHN